MFSEPTNLLPVLGSLVPDRIAVKVEKSYLRRRGAELQPQDVFQQLAGAQAVESGWPCSQLLRQRATRRDVAPCVCQIEIRPPKRRVIEPSVRLEELALDSHSAAVLKSESEIEMRRFVEAVALRVFADRETVFEVSRGNVQAWDLEETRKSRASRRSAPNTERD